MHYVRQSLGENEELVHVAHFHWIYTFGAVLNIVVGIIIAIIIAAAAIKIQPMLLGTPAPENWIDSVRGLHPGIKIVVFLAFLMGLFRFVQMMIVKVTTEIAITNTRLIYKRGLVARYVGELNIDRIEGVNVLQSFFGRIFGYGRILVRGLGVGEVLLPTIADPIRFRKAIEKARTV